MDVNCAANSNTLVLFKAIVKPVSLDNPNFLPGKLPVAIMVATWGVKDMALLHSFWR